MRVLFDDIFLVNNKSGIARYWQSVFRYWNQSEEPRASDVEFIILNRSGSLDGLGFEMVDFPRISISDPYRAEDRRLISRICESLAADVFLSSYYTFALDTPTMGFVYDFIPERQGFQNQHWSWIERQLSVYASTSFIGISESTIDDLLELHPWIQRSNCSVALPGVDNSVFRRRLPQETEDFKKRHKLNDYLVFAGHRGDEGHYKNFDLVLRSINERRITGFDLVLTGGQPISQYEKEVFQRRGVRTIRLDLDDDDLAVCFSGAEALIYPSLYEGFGLPPLESLAVGTPVITTLTSSLPESVGTLTIPISGNSPEELGECLNAALSQSWRTRIRAEGPLWASRFQWGTTATNILAAIAGRNTESKNQLDPQVKRLLCEYNNQARNLQC